jgi:hypothetical protein
MGITISNKKFYDGEGIYIGREMPGVKASILGNPYDYESKIYSIRLFELWLFKKLLNPNSLASIEIDRLITIYKETKNLNLICWCSPLPCHGEIIANLIRISVNEPKEQLSWHRRKYKK